MEKLTLVCGRFIPPRGGGDTAERVERLEAYLSKLTQELELMVRDIDGILADLAALGAASVSAASDGEEGKV